MRTIAVDTPEDIAWLLENHGIAAKFAVIIGNEDTPHCIWAYEVASPEHDSLALYYSANKEGKYVSDGRLLRPTF